MSDINALDYDLIIVGSDEVWNFNDIAYSPIKFGYGLECPHISYAASVGGSLASDDNIPAEVRIGIKNFGRISVRDEKTEESENKVFSFRLNCESDNLVKRSNYARFSWLDSELVNDLSSMVCNIIIGVKLNG